MRAVVDEWEVGVVCRDFTAGALAASLNELTLESIWRYKQGAHAAARMLNAGANAELIRGIMRNALDGRA